MGTKRCCCCIPSIPLDGILRMLSLMKVRWDIKDVVLNEIRPFHKETTGFLSTKSNNSLGKIRQLVRLPGCCVLSPKWLSFKSRAQIMRMGTSPKLPELQECSANTPREAQGGIVWVAEQGQGLDLMIPVGPFLSRRFSDSRNFPGIL